MIPRLRLALAIATPCVALPATSARLVAQQPGIGVVPVRGFRFEDVTVGSPQENTLLILSLLANSKTQTTIRPLSVLERRELADSASLRSSTKFRWARPLVDVWYNSGSANPTADGVVWQGKGLTAAVSGGAVYEAGIRHVAQISLALRPIAFTTQNLAYGPPTPFPVPPGSYRNQFYGTSVDLPFRFGDKAYSRGDWGESSARLTLGPAALGWSSASQWLGPARLYPLVMGVEAGGFQHVFLETAKGLDFWFGRVSGRWEMGRLETSGFLGQPTTPRILPALVVSLTPRGWSGMEIGGIRLFHANWEPGAFSMSTATLPLAGWLKKSNPTNEGSTLQYNQIASAFFRLAPPGSGVEAYGELYREDASYDSRDLVSEPDHEIAYTVGMRRAWRGRNGVVRAFTIENANSRKSHLQRVRDEPPLYLHFQLLDGHTSRGQPLGSGVIPGGGGLGVQLDEIADDHAWTLRVEHRRIAQDREGGTWGGAYIGEYAATLSHRSDRFRWVSGWTIGLRNGYGLAKGTSVTIGTTYRPH